MWQNLVTFSLPFGLSCSTYGQHKAAPSGAEYKIAFASFASLNLEIFVAEADGQNAKPLLPSPAQDYNASFLKKLCRVGFPNDGKMRKHDEQP